MNRIAVCLKLVVSFVVGFLLWNCALLGINVIAQRCNIDLVWTVVLSRLALFGYLLPFALWYFVEPQKVYAFCLGEKQASIQMPFIWYGIKDNVRRVSTVFSLLFLGLAGVFFYTNRRSVSILLAGISFAVVNSILEEFLWRGLILSRTIHLWGEKCGLILMSLAFGLYHYPLGFSIPVCLLFSLGGIYFGGMTIRSKGLLLGTLMHISMNLFFVAIGIIL